MKTLLLLLVLASPDSGATPQAQAAEVQNPLVEPVPLDFSEILEPGPRGFHLSSRLREWAGRRVRMVGFMPRMEIPPRGAFYLCPRPLVVDESGSGTADLPPNAVRIIVRSAAGQEYSFIPGPLEVTGILEIGRREEDDGSVSSVRLILDRPEDAAPSAPEPKKTSQ